MDTRQWIQDNADNDWVLDDTHNNNFIIRKALNRGRGPKAKSENHYRVSQKKE